MPSTALRITCALAFTLCVVALLVTGTPGVPLVAQQGPAPASTTKSDTPGVDARLLRYPAISQHHIAFVYAGDIWLTQREFSRERPQADALRLTTALGEERFPRFSPDGQTLAFSANYDGNEDIYTIPVGGGIAKRITHHPDADVVNGWTPDGSGIVYTSGMSVGSGRYSQLWVVPKEGGLPTRLAPEVAEFGQLSPNGEWLAFTPWQREFRTWKRYRGGMASKLWLLNLKSLESRLVPTDGSNDALPMWLDDNRIAFLSDRDQHKRNAIWQYSLTNAAVERITPEDANTDIRWPSSHGDDLLYQGADGLYLKQGGEAPVRLSISLLTDGASLRPQLEKLESHIKNVDLSPNGKRLAFEARGEVVSVPAEKGLTINLTQSSGIAERNPTYSPDGKEIAYFSDASGEYDLYVRPAEGMGEPTLLARLGEGFRYTPHWSPDGRKIVWVEQDMEIQCFNRDTGKVTQIDREHWIYEGELRDFRVSFSADSRFMAYTMGVDNGQNTLRIWDSTDGKLHTLTSDFYSSWSPVFDPEGSYLYFLQSSELNPIYSDLDPTWIYSNTTQVLAMPLRKDVASPIGTQNDSEANPEADDDERPRGERQPKADTPAKPVTIDFNDIESRSVILPIASGNISDLHAVKGKLIYRRRPNTGAPRSEQAKVMSYDLKKRKEKKLADGADSLQVASGAKHMLIRARGKYRVLGIDGGGGGRGGYGGGSGDNSGGDTDDGERRDSTVDTSAMEAVIDPREEWQQLFTEAWRFERDYFYDRNLHHVDWSKQRAIYGELLNHCITRWDVNHVIGEMLGELNCGHVYRWGGDTEAAPSRSVGMLGCDWAMKDGKYIIKHIVHGAPWDAEVRSPLADSALDVQEGDTLLAVNGTPLDTSKDPWAALQGTAGRATALTISRKGDGSDAREVLVTPLASDNRLRYLEWVESKRRWVDEQSGGKIGYIYVPNTGRNGQTELVRQFRAQHHKDGMIIDERFNGGGQLPDRFVELLNRPTLCFWGTRDGGSWKTPSVSCDGPKVMLINGRAGSGGDAFPWYFKQTGTGKLIGERTWGGLVGYTGMPGLIDGGTVIAPTFGIYSPEGEWIIEGYGVDPDIEVIADPGKEAKGEDPQLERALQEVREQLKANPPRRAKRPEGPDRSHGK